MDEVPEHSDGSPDSASDAVIVSSSGTEPVRVVGRDGAVSFEGLALKSDHEHRPIYVCPDRRIFLETWSRVYREAYDFLIAVAEPMSRPMLVHEYRLTAHSLLAAVSVGLETEEIISFLELLSKVPISVSVKNFIRACTQTFGRAMLVLRDNRFFVESAHPEAFKTILSNPVIRDSLVKKKLAIDASEEKPKRSLTEELAERLIVEDTSTTLTDSAAEMYEVVRESVDTIKRECVVINAPLLEEYDFRADSTVVPLRIDLRPTTQIRGYQEKSLSKMFGNGRARSGIIVLPCGAGKTLVGITAACTMKKCVLVLCTSAVAVEQWRNQFKLWSNATDRHITRFTSETKGLTDIAPILITTYPMVAFPGKRSATSEVILARMRQREWGLIILDEVHVVPADTFRTVLTICNAHTKLGLTATLVREDDLVRDLYWLIGPKLYEANWLDLQRDRHIARVQCAEVWCEMDPSFFREYLLARPSKRKLLYIMNPRKFRTCHYLINYHEARGDKILVFSDNVEALVTYARQLGKYFICGPTAQHERMDILDKFQYQPNINTIFISKVGDNSIDLPEANVIIQISSHFGSRRQEAQRLGRILRPKQQSYDEYNAFFYSLISRDTQEMAYSTKRQRFLLDQGYAFKVITSIVDDSTPNLVLGNAEQRKLLLKHVLLASDEKGNTEMFTANRDDMPDADYGEEEQIPGSLSANLKKKPRGTKRNEGLFYNRKEQPAKRAKIVHHRLFRQRKQ